MALKLTRIENRLSYMLNAKRAKRTSHKLYKKFRNRKHRRLMKSDLEYIPYYNRYKDWEY